MDNFEKLRIFYDHEKLWLENLQIRWEDEYNYEDPEDYKKVIIEKAKNYDLTVKKVKLSYRDLSIKITFQFPNQIGHIDILKTRNKVYLNNVLK